MAFFDRVKNLLNVERDQSKQSEGSFCSNCGNKLNTGAKFCSSCGNAVVENGGLLNEASGQMSNTRHQEYIGTVLKCANCGAVITQTTAVCPECGIKITGQAVVKSVQEFSAQLMELERQNKKGWCGIGTKDTKPQILILIKTFPIPNAIDDILEFILLANANIDVSLSKRGFFGNSSSSAAEVSNAWVLKMQQAYQKAEIAFPADPAFKQIQKIYFDKMKELKIKV